MPRFVALLRGVNVGKAKRVPMAALKALLAELGYRDVRTLLNSGNAVFDGAAGSSAAQATRIQAAIVATFGFDVPVIVKSSKDIAAILAENTLAKIATDHSRLLVAFTPGAKGLEQFAALAHSVVAPERILVGKHAAYLWCANGILESPAASALLGKSGSAVTTRNWATVTKIAALL